MATNTTISERAALAACNQYRADVELGTGPGSITLYEGSQPTTPDGSDAGSKVLAVFTLQENAYQAATIVDQQAIAVLDPAQLPITVPASDSGQAQWARVKDGDGNGVKDGTVGTSNSDFIIDDPSLVSGQDVRLNAHQLVQPQTS